MIILKMVFQNWTFIFKNIQMKVCDTGNELPLLDVKGNARLAAMSAFPNF